MFKTKDDFKKEDSNKLSFEEYQEYLKHNVKPNCKLNYVIRRSKKTK